MAQQSILITGAGGQLGSVLLPLARARGLAPWGTVSPSGRGHPDPNDVLSDVLALDLREPAPLVRRVLAEPPRAIIHLAAISQLGRAYHDPLLAHEVNVEVTGELSHLASRVGARFIYASTDMVFDGHRAPYGEDDTPEPTSTYGRTKLAGEAHALRHPDALVARLPLLFGVPALAPERAHLVQLAQQRPPGAPRPKLFSDEFRTPLSLRDAAQALLQLAFADGLSGVIHLGGPERVSRAELGRRWAAARGAQVDFDTISVADLTFDEPRPPDLSLRSDRYQTYFGSPPGGTLDAALAACAAELDQR